MLKFKKNVTKITKIQNGVFVVMFGRNPIKLYSTLSKKDSIANLSINTTFKLLYELKGGHIEYTNPINRHENETKTIYINSTFVVEWQGYIFVGDEQLFEEC